MGVSVQRKGARELTDLCAFSIVIVPRQPRAIHKKMCRRLLPKNIL